METVKFYFDPGCPWCYQTSRWAKRLAELGEIDLDWGLFSLDVVNAPEGTDPLDMDAPGGPALRTAVAIGDTHGSRAIGPFYTALGQRNFEAGEPPSDATAAIRESLGDAGLDGGLLDAALDDPKTWARVVESTLGIVDRVGRLGVPTIVLDGGDGPAIFGPVVSLLPTDEDAVELWRHTLWLTRYENFAELKRSRQPQDDLPVMKWWRAKRAEREAQERQEKDKASA
jgi:2-hydroxychromene-2-carboxylate isomerase